MAEIFYADGKAVKTSDETVSITTEQYAQLIISMQKLQAVKAIVDDWTSFSEESDVILAVQRIVT